MSGPFRASLRCLLEALRRADADRAALPLRDRTLLGFTVPLGGSIRPGEHPVGPSGAPRVSTRSSQIAVPRWLRSGSRALGVVPLQSRHILPAVRSSCTGSGSLEVLRPYDDVTRASPRLRWSVLSHHGSALRFSQPLSGFLAHPSLATFFHAAAARGVLPSERCSSLGSRAPLGVACSPAVLHHRT